MNKPSPLLQMLRLHNKALRAMPSSPRQKAILAELRALEAAHPGVKMSDGLPPTKEKTHGN